MIKLAIFCQINYFKNILYVKFYFESIGDNFEATGLLFFRDFGEKPKNFDENSIYF
jgi:hypothetical protein